MPAELFLSYHLRFYKSFHHLQSCIWKLQIFIGTLLLSTACDFAFSGEWWYLYSKLTLYELYAGWFNSSWTVYLETWLKLKSPLGDSWTSYKVNRGLCIVTFHATYKLNWVFYKSISVMHFTKFYFDFFCTKLIIKFLLRLILDSYLCHLILDSFITNKRHSFDIQPSCLSVGGLPCSHTV